MSIVEKIESNIKKFEEDLKNKRIYLNDIESQIDNFERAKQETKDVINALTGAIQASHSALSIAKDTTKEGV